MKHFLRSFVLGISIPVALASAATEGCSGSSTGSAAAPDAGGKDASIVADTGAAADTGGASDTGSPSSLDAGSDAPQCTAFTTSDTCRNCCMTAYPAGYNLFGSLTLACACAGSYCGPSEAGAPEGGVGDAGDGGDSGDAGADDAAVASDGGLYGQASCALTCNMTQVPDTACNACILQTLGTDSNPGPCGLAVVMGCVPNADCSAYFACVENCPF